MLTNEEREKQILFTRHFMLDTVAMLDERISTFHGITRYPGREVAQVTQPKADCIVGLSWLQYESYDQLKQLVAWWEARRIILSFPRFKTTDYNKLHKLDVKDVNVMTLLPSFKVVFRHEELYTFMVLDQKAKK